MQKQNLTSASHALFNRRPDERFESLDHLMQHCSEDKRRSIERWHAPSEVSAVAEDGQLGLRFGDHRYRLNDWSFSQVCRLANVSKDTLNKLSAETAERVLGETMPSGGKPLQAWIDGDSIRSVHGTSYTRLYNADLLSVVSGAAVDFTPPQRGMNGGTGLYCGEQDLFAFLIDPTGWAEIEGEAFAPGFFIWNSECGRRSVGIQSFWFQAVCQNHILWDAVEVATFTRKHTANVANGLAEIREVIGKLVEARDTRRGGFVHVMRKAFTEKLGDDVDSVAKVLLKHRIPRDIGKQALKLAEEQGRFTIFSVVDALTRVAQKYENAGDRAELDERAGRLLSLAD